MKKLEVNTQDETQCEIEWNRTTDKYLTIQVPDDHKYVCPWMQVKLCPYALRKQGSIPSQEKSMIVEASRRLILLHITVYAIAEPNILKNMWTRD